MGYLMVHDAIRTIPGFPEDLAVQLEHMILSHHGELEYGSPKVPMTMEAMILHLADYSDAKLKQVEVALAEDKETGHWTAYHRTLGRNLYKSDNGAES
jgi:3'-5' exoribonuclease